ncbi:MAG: VWA domain-containing protein [Pirellulaceae bacterium]
MIPLPLAQIQSRTTLQWMRLESFDQWWHWIALALAIAAAISYLVFWWRRDTAELPRPLRWTLLVLRSAAWLGVLLFFLDLQKRSEEEIQKPSRVAVLVDTSLSMSLPADWSTGGEGASRTNEVTKLLQGSDWLPTLNQQHEVAIYRFDESPKPLQVALLPRNSSNRSDQTASGSVNAPSVWRAASWAAWIGSLLIAAGLLVIGLTLLVRGRSRESSLRQASWLLAATLTAICGLIIAGTGVLRGSQFPLRSLWHWTMPAMEDLDPPKPSADPSQSKDLASIDWTSALAPVGTQSRLGDAMQAILDQERGNPLAAMILLTDGQSNAGINPEAAVADAALAGVPLRIVGLGSSDLPNNVRLVDVDAPKRVFPGDPFRLSALLQSTGFAGKTVQVQLRRSRSSDRPADADFSIVDELPVELAASDSLTPVQFEIEPPELGEWIYEVKCLPPPGDSNLLDDRLDTSVRVVEPKSKVLTIAGGPTREYQFVRNLLFRDKTIQSHVYLQTGAPGMSQEAQELLDAFPNSLQQLSEYDCILAFDTDWMALSTEQLDALEQWVAEQAGGLVMIAGPVATPRWAGTEGNGDRRATILRGLCPVDLNARGLRLLSLGRFEADTAWPLKITEDGARTDFLQVHEDPQKAQNAWDQFRGVYSYFASFDPKPGAQTLALFTDPAAAQDGKLPVFLASQFFGAGRVVFQGSGEIWRLREQGEGLFDTYYTKLVRWVSQGRLLRDSNRGILLLDKEEAMVGETVSVRAILKDAQLQPWIQPAVEARLADPNQRTQTIRLSPMPDSTQPGVYLGQFVIRQPGNHTLQLSFGSISEPVVLSQQVAGRVPATEVQSPQRNDPLLELLANRSSGTFFRGVEPAIESAASGQARLIDGLKAQDQTQFLPGAPDPSFQERWMLLLMAMIAGCLGLEWLLRRLHRLA